MNKFSYEVKTNESINYMRLSDFSMQKFDSKKRTFNQPVNLEEGYIQIIYPQREDYIANLKTLGYRNLDYKNLYVPFENNKVEFSSFIGVPHELSISGEIFAEVEEDSEYKFELITCGSVEVYVNEELFTFFAPMTRNVATTTNVTIPLKKGVNKINMFARELAERDVFFYFEMKNVDHKSLNCFTEVNDREENIKHMVELLTSFSLNKDEYKDNEEVMLTYDNTLLTDDVKISLGQHTSLINPVHYIEAFNFEYTLSKDTNVISLGNSKDLPKGVQMLAFKLESLDGDISRPILYSNEIEQPVDLDTYEERSKFVYENLAKYSPNNITKALLLAAQNDNSEAFDMSFKNGIDFISTHADCADFQTVPLLWLMTKYQEQMGEEKFELAKKTMIEFRYWIDEPGSDAMWFFSENHAFLFHISQYLSGHLFQEDTFEVSGRTGKEQYQLGYDRLIHWFEVFNKYEFAEWNSTTYFPVDFIGFTTLYECAPDKKIRDLAKAAMDRCFEIIEMNLHHNLMVTTYGRVYEKELKGLPNGELSLITWMIFNQGYYNHTNRASIMLLISSYRYQPSNKYVVDDDQKHEIVYQQGLNKVCNYVYKTKDYQIGAAINYKYMLKGHQQHMMNISFSTDEIQLWLNNPGEKVYSGENRPSYWAGNGINPKVYVKNNAIIYNYDNRNSLVKYTHMYFPTYLFDHYEVDGNYAFVEHKGTYLALRATSKASVTTISSIRDRELRFEDTVGSIAVMLFNKEDYATLDELKADFKASKLTLDNESSYFRFKDDEYKVTANQFYKNWEFVDYESFM